jgi:hypothetical protein
MPALLLGYVRVCHHFGNLYDQADPAALAALQVPPVTVPPRPETPRIAPTPEPEADKICNLEPGYTGFSIIS